MARFSDDKIEEVRSRSDIVEVIGAQVRLRRAGRNFVGLCPFHTEKTPSFSVNAERGFFHCFGCGAGGTVFNFLMRTEGLSFPEALESLARRYGIKLPERDEAGVVAGDREAVWRANQTAAEFFAHVLWNTPEGAGAREYLGVRAVAADTARAFMLGFAPERPASLTRALEKRGLVAAGMRVGLLKQDSGGVRDMFRARLMFPIRDTQGRVIAFGGRVLDQRLPKYINSPESPVYSKARTLYGLYEARAAIARTDRAIVVEGYLDAIALWQAGFQETVASLGTSLTIDQLRLLARHTRNVLACFDGDDAGRKASLRALETFLAAGMLGRGIFIPSGFDPDTLVKARGAAAFAELVEAAQPLADLFFEELVKDAGGSDAPMEKRIAAARRIGELLRPIQDMMQANALMGRASGRLGIAEDVIRRFAKPDRRPGSRPGRDPRLEILASVPNGVEQAEVGLLATALLHPGLRSEIMAHAAIFEDAAIAAAVAQVCASREPPAALEVGVAEVLSDVQRDRLSELAVGPLIETEEQARALVPDYVETLARRQRQRAMEATRRAAMSAGSADEAAAAAQELIALRRRGG